MNGIHEVRGSIPLGSTNEINLLDKFFVRAVRSNIMPPRHVGLARLNLAIIRRVGVDRSGRRLSLARPLCWGRVACEQHRGRRRMPFELSRLRVDAIMGKGVPRLR